jgi:TonB family protein
VAAHAGAFFALPRSAPVPVASSQTNQVDFQVMERRSEPEPQPEPEPPPEPPPEPEPEPAEPEPERRPKPKPKPEPEEPQPDLPDNPFEQQKSETPPPKRKPETKPKQAEQAAAPAQETPVRFDEVLSNTGDQQSSWKVPEASGHHGGQAGIPTDREREGQRKGRPGGTGRANEGPRVVPFSDLSRPPTPPNLDGRLKSNYPERARRQGIEAVVRTRVRINPDGSISHIRVRSQSQSGYGFGEACKETLQGSRWEPGCDGQGRPVACHVTYKCTFKLDE